MLTLNCRGRLLTADKPIVMGILNCTPDSFFSDSRVCIAESAIEKATKMVKDGAIILDIGGQSTRPGSERVSDEEELGRVIPIINAIRAELSQVFISIDTFYASVAREAVLAGADMVNDISAGLIDTAMINTVANLKVPFLMMHMKGTPQNMQQHIEYVDLIVEIIDYFTERVEYCRQAGIQDIVIDPGFGFSKTIDQNFSLLKHLNEFKNLDMPLLIGVSRKSSIYKTLGITADEALNGTTILHTLALLNGADILRVHDVKEAIEAVKLTELYKNKKAHS
jgi:dihydropteroate synthase